MANKNSTNTCTVIPSLALPDYSRYAEVGNALGNARLSHPSLGSPRTKENWNSPPASRVRVARVTRLLNHTARVGPSSTCCHKTTMQSVTGACRFAAITILRYVPINPHFPTHSISVQFALSRTQNKPILRTKVTIMIS